MNLRAWVVLTCFGAASPAAASGNQVVGTHFGLSVPIGDGSEFVEPGFHVGGEYFYELDTSFAWGLRAGYHRFSLDGDEALASAIPVEAVEVFPFESSGSYDFFELVQCLRLSHDRVFAQFGFGLYHLRSSATVDFGFNLDGSGTPSTGVELGGDFDETKPGVHIGGGVRFRTSPRVSVSMLALYDIVFTNVQNTQWVRGSGGVSLHF